MAFDQAWRTAGGPQPHLVQRVTAYEDRTGGETHVEDYSEFYRAEFAAIHRTVFLTVQDRGRAEEITQEAFVQALLRWKKIVEYDRPAAWVRRVAIRLAVKHLKRERIRSRVEREPESTHSDPARDVDVLRAIATLPPKQRAAVVLFYFEDRPINEIADLMQCSPSAAKVSLHRGRKALAEILVFEVSADVH